MEKIILYVDDAVYASEQFAELAPDADNVVARHWVLVACAPRMTHRISKWVSHSARENWRAKWFSKVQAQMLPLLERNGGQVTAVLAKGPLTDLTQQLKREHAATHVVDARRPKIGVDLEPVAPDQTPPKQSGWAFPGAVMGMGALLVLANELAE
ncbi:hypothetical protein CY658_14140 [Variovorax sp. RO1]|uniref:hypothetical protein n=1 Tax=unclassified Variovorax TaxID=663243 RepID=UPI000C7185EE|nr:MULTISPECIES: hypothetical protein [unclassified Variovorax]PLC04943.1 hypothetical protein CY658_14140 [Variovorax sp. RO1]QOF78478.1 hypothetical protein IG196_30055 [Variovorax sp. 38R]